LRRVREREDFIGITMRRTWSSR